MKPEITSMIMEEIFARWPASFCRVAGAVTEIALEKMEKVPVLNEFCGRAGFLSCWHGRC